MFKKILGWVILAMLAATLVVMTLAFCGWRGLVAWLAPALLTTLIWLAAVWVTG